MRRPRQPRTKCLGYLYQSFPAGRPPVIHFAEAWESTARVLQLGVRGGKMLRDLSEADSAWQHFWTTYTPGPRNTVPSSQDDGPGQGQGRVGKVAGKGGKHAENPDAIRQIQQKKDKYISQLKRELEQSKNQQGSTSSSYAPSGGRWKSQRKWK